MAAESYPADLKYHPEHDWARVEGDEATFGITWFAQDALGELVHFEPPEVGQQVARTAPTASRVRQGRDRPGGAALGRDRRGQREVVDAPETVNEDPYGAGWLVRVRLDDASEVDSLLDVDAYTQLLEAQCCRTSSR